MAKNEQLVKLIEALVRKEVARIAPTIIRETMTRVMGNMILEAADSIEVSPPTSSNSGKRKALQENTVTYDTDDWSTLGGETLTTQSDIRRVAPQRTNRQNLITVDAAMSGTELGHPVPIDPNSLPDHLIEAFNHDYSKLMKTYLIDGKK